MSVWKFGVHIFGEPPNIKFRTKVVPNSKENLKRGTDMDKPLKIYSATRIRNDLSLTEIRSVPLSI